MPVPVPAPEYSVRGLTEDLAEGRILAPVAGDPDAFVPARDVQVLTVMDVLRAAGALKLDAPSLDQDPQHRVIARVLGRLEDAHKDAVGGLTIARLIRELEEESPPQAGAEGDGPSPPSDEEATRPPPEASDEC